MNPTITKILIDKHKKRTNNIFEYGHFSYGFHSPDHNLKNFIDFMHSSFRENKIDSYLVKYRNNSVTFIYFTGPVVSVMTTTSTKDSAIVDGELTDVQEIYGLR